MPVMKRTFLLLTLLFFILFKSAAQINGNGTLANPYIGINAGDFTITGTKYFNGNLGVSSGTLTLMPGTKLICLSRYACILISGTGRISALGTSTRQITITADTDVDGIVGESTDFWGNIVMTSSGTSTFDYCTIENGRRTRFSFLGGAFEISSGTVTINHSTIRNSSAGKGGGIYANAGASLTVTNTLFLNNRATDQGGAIYVAAGATPVISSSLFRNNSSSSALLKGGTIAVLSASPVIVNSTIVYSDSPAADGRTIYLENSPDATIVNTVIWGGSSHIGLSGTPSTVFEYSAIEGESYAGCLNLNSSNTAADGPNFTNPVTGDLSLTFVSPMRDTGADSYTGITVPAFDFIGSGRVGVTDMGAYEMIYSRWRGGTTSWSASGNWDAGFVPGTTNVIIPSGKATYPTDSPGPTFTLNAGLEMVLEPGAQATFSSLTNNGRIDLHSDATGIASLLTSSYSGAGGNMNVELFLTAGPAGDWWHYIASPVTVSKTVFTAIEPDLLARYDETKVLTDVVDGWQWHDGYGGTESFNDLTAREGYDVSVASDVTMSYNNLKSLTTSMGRIDLPFSGSGGDTTIFGYSLLGNSLTCGINWDQVTYSHETELLKHAYYIRTPSGEDASYVDGVGTNGATAHIAPLQGFFVRTRTTGSYITIPDNAREHNGAPRFKSAEQIPLVRLTISSAAARDEMVVRFDPRATLDFDGFIDAGKILSHVRAERLKIYSVLKGENYSINAIPWPEKKTTIPLTIMNPEAGTLKIKRSQLQAIGNYNIILTDRLAGKSVDLLAYSEYSFSAPAGTISDRFTLTVSPVEKSAVTEENPRPEGNSLKIYSASGKVCILPQGSDWDGISGKVRIFDITGRLLFAENEERFNSGELKEYDISAAGGLLIVEVTTGPKRYLEKIVLTR
ncbi:right-handed parallel beta-helix repeat-containing protein [bacterium]|nr:right-handed parallel beta-helix repeat-containing protein [bacterium]